MRLSESELVNQKSLGIFSSLRQHPATSSEPDEQSQLLDLEEME